MRFVDVADPSRVARSPDHVLVIFENGSFRERGFEVIRAELRLYNERSDENLGTYSLITSVVYTGRDSIEMVYDEGFRGENPLEREGRMLSAHLGVAGMVLRSVIALERELAGADLDQIR